MMREILIFFRPILAKFDIDTESNDDLIDYDFKATFDLGNDGNGKSQ